MSASKSRLRKLECSQCGFIARCSAGAVQSSGYPTCGCGTVMSCGTLADLAVIDPDQFDALLDAAQTVASYNALLAEAGYPKRDRGVPLRGKGRYSLNRRPLLEPLPF